MTEGLSRLDLADDEVRRDAEAELRRAEMGDGAAMAVWARKWARPALSALHELAEKAAPWDEGDYL
jgi:hypothetical protein